MGFSALLLGGTALGGAYMAGKGAKSANVQSPAAPPQASKVPDVNTIVAGQAGTGQAGGSPGVAQTFLTGPGGIDPSLLKLGKATLLGG